MTNYREILRLHSLGLNKTEIAASCQCARNTVAATLQRAANCGLQWPLPEEMSDKQLAELLFPTSASKPVYKMPDYAYIHKELQRSGVTLNLLWLEYCDQCRATGQTPYQSTQFNKYYSDYLAKTNATMHLNHKPGEIMQVDWAGDTASVIDTDTGEIIPAYVFVATLPYSGYSYVEAFFSMNQEAWTTAHVNAYKYFGGVTRIIQCDNLKTGVQKHGKDELILNKAYQELAEHYGTAILPARVRSPKDKAAVEGTVGIISTFILAALRNRQFLSLQELNEAVWERLEVFNQKPFQKREGSRASCFAEEKPFLRSLPSHPFELATWKVATRGPLIWASVGAKTLELVHENIDVAGVKEATEADILELDADLIEDFIEGKEGAQKKAKKIEIDLVARIIEHTDDPRFIKLGERLEELREKHEQGLITSIEFLKHLLELAHDAAQAEREVVPVAEIDRGKAALTELFNSIKNANTPVIVERKRFYPIAH